MKITQADAPTIWMDYHPILTNRHPNLCHPHNFMPDALPGTTLPINPGLGQAPKRKIIVCVGETGTKYAGLHTRWLGYLMACLSVCRWHGCDSWEWRWCN